MDYRKASPRRRRRSSRDEAPHRRGNGEGAMGLSTALLQPPSSFATTANLIELARTAAVTAASTRPTSVMRARASSARSTRRSRWARAGIPVDIIHMKIAHKKLWGRANEIIARRRGPRHPRQRLPLHRSGQNNLSSIVPPVGARRRPREAARAAQGSVSADARGGHERPAELANHYLATGTGGPG